MNGGSPSSRPRHRGPKPPLSRDAVVRAALGCLREGGPAGLTMRGVAARLQTGPSSLYTFVRDQRELHVLVLDAVAAKVPRSSSCTGEEAVVELLLAYARQLRAFPGAARLALLTPPTGPAFLDLLEAVLEGLSAEGLPISSAERTCDALFLLVTASVAEQEARRGGHSVPDLIRQGLDLSSTPRPHLAAALKLVEGQSGADRLEWFLRALLVGVR